MVDRMGAICTNLQALSPTFTPAPLPDVKNSAKDLANLIRLLGPRLRYLQINYLCNPELEAIRCAILAITTYCRSLEYLELIISFVGKDSEDEASAHPDLYLDMVQR
ncbi:hypothetical protein HK102_014160 [Quaeritorhiza haematococci]|nr:hypothetical protein HK102_014160 [Quaeritorhiza haematococci]